MHVYLWAPVTYISNNSGGCHLLNAMYDLMQFVVSTITTDTHAEHLVKLFIKNVVLLFSMVVILAVDADSRFKSVFKYMCAALGIIYWPLARGNHKGTSVEKYHRFLKKRQAI